MDSKQCCFALIFLKLVQNDALLAKEGEKKKKEKKSWLGTPWKCLVLGSRCAPFAPKPHLCERATPDYRQGTHQPVSLRALVYLSPLYNIIQYIINI